MSALSAAADRAQAWMTGAALPLWASAGVDEAGAFHETLDFQGRPDPASARRMRVQARQTYVFCQAAERGWLADARAVAERGCERMIERCWAVDGAAGFIHTLGPDGRPLDLQRDAYDQAFGLFALAWRYRLDRDPGTKAVADALVDLLRGAMAHPAGGVVESLPPALPRRSNPHMHLLEAYLAWAEVAGDPRYLEGAAQMIALFKTRFFDPSTSTYGEFFTEDLRRDPGPPGEEVWPGHHFEWVWLLSEAGRLGLDGCGEEAGALYEFAMAHGLDDQRFAIDEMDRHGRPVRRSRRAWNQTELIKAHVAMARAGRPGAAAAAASVTEAFLDTYLATERPGLWMDQFDADGQGIAKDVPASTLYHVVVAFRELIDLAASTR